MACRKRRRLGLEPARSMTQGCMGKPLMPLRMQFYLDTTGNILSREILLADLDSDVMDTEEMLPS